MSLSNYQFITGIESTDYPEKSGKVGYEPKGLLGTTLIEIAVYIHVQRNRKFIFLKFSTYTVYCYHSKI